MNQLGTTKGRKSFGRAQGRRVLKGGRRTEERDVKNTTVSPSASSFGKPKLNREVNAERLR